MVRNILKRVVTLALFLTALLWIEGNYGPFVTSHPPTHLGYVVRATPGEDFNVELRASGLRGQKPEFRILNGWGVLQDQSEHIEDVRAVDEDGTPIPVTRRVTEEETLWQLERRPTGEVRLTYRVRQYDPERSPEASFARKEIFVFLGYSVFLEPRAFREQGDTSISVRVMAPKSWPQWASWPRSGSTFHPKTLHDLWSGVSSGGNFKASRLELGAVSVTVLTERSIQDLMGLTIANRLLPLMREMHALFGAPPRGDSLSVLALYRVLPAQEKLSVMTGNSEEGAFLCLASPDRYANAEPLTVLAAHECLHFYLGGAIAASPEPPFRNAPDLIWLMEGVTEYLTYKLMVRAGVITLEDFTDVVIRKEKEYMAVPGWSQLSLADAARQMSDMDTYTMVYSRGFLVADMLDREMEVRCGKGTFEEALRVLFREHSFYANGDVVTPEMVSDTFSSLCPDARELITRYAEGRERIPAIPRVRHRRLSTTN